MSSFISRLRSFRTKSPKSPTNDSGTGEISPLQLYRGYDESDLALLAAFAAGPSSIGTDHYVDGFGVKTPYSCVPFVDPKTLNPSRLEHPVPDDGFHAEAIEYLALLDSMNRSKQQNSYCGVELGAGWGPWISMAGVIAKRIGIETISLVGVEASRERFDMMCRQLEHNSLRSQGATGEDDHHNGVFTRLFQGAIWTHDGNIWFPESDAEDMGAAASLTDEAEDYRGTACSNSSVPCRTLQKLLGGLDMVDFMHIDIQGAEYELLCNAIDWISDRTRAMMIATHSRPIEGKLIDLLFENGWQLYREKPCRVNWGSKCSITGKTIVDGSQYWLNRRFADLHG